MTDPGDTHPIQRVRAPRLALGATVRKVALLSFAASAVLLAGLWLQMASGRDPALTAGAGGSGLGEPAESAALAAPAEPAPASTPAPVQTTSS